MKRCLVIVAAVALPFASSAQPTTSDTQRRANEAWTAQDWAKAAEAYDALLREDPRAAQPHFRLAVSLIALGRHGESRAHLAVAESLGTPAAQVAFRLAQIHAKAGATDSAFQQLKRATSAGLSTAPVAVDSDPDIARLKSDARFAEFLTDMDRNARPCMHNARYREFDFWLGTWDVRPNGQPSAPPARNVITKIHNGCVVLESWSAQGSTGQSFNIYDRTRGKWFQTWVDGFGGLHEYAGELRDGNMVFEGDMPAPRPSNARVHTRLTFFQRPDGSVRQFSERTADSGATWQVNYDLIYTRSATTPPGAPAPDLLHPGDSRVSGTFLRPYQRDVTQIITSADGRVINARVRWRDELRETQLSGRRVLQRLMTMYRFDDSVYAADTVLFDRFTLAPISTVEWVAGTLVWRRRYDGLRVSGSRLVVTETVSGRGASPNDPSRRLATSIGAPVFDFHGGMDAIVAAAIPLVVGQSTRLAVYDPTRDSVVSLQLRVLRREPVEAGRGRFANAYVVEYDGLNGPMRLWVSREAPFLFKSEETVLQNGKPSRIITALMLS